MARASSGKAATCLPHRKNVARVWCLSKMSSNSWSLGWGPSSKVKISSGSPLADGPPAGLGHEPACTTTGTTHRSARAKCHGRTHPIGCGIPQRAIPDQEVNSSNRRSTGLAQSQSFSLCASELTEQSPSSKGRRAQFASKLGCSLERNVVVAAAAKSTTACRTEVIGRGRRTITAALTAAEHNRKTSDGA